MTNNCTTQSVMISLNIYIPKWVSITGLQSCGSQRNLLWNCGDLQVTENWLFDKHLTVLWMTVHLEMTKLKGTVNI